MGTILGINAGAKDTSAAIIRDGTISFAIKEERLNRQKRTRSFPIEAIQTCLQYVHRDILDLDAVAVSWNPAINLKKFNYSQSLSPRYKPELFYSIANYLFTLLPQNDFEYSAQEFHFANSKKIKVYFITHHLSHAIEAFYGSSFKECAILTMDAYGEKNSLMMAQGRGNKAKVIRTIDFPYSIGSFYGAFTQFLGFQPDCDEWKVMGASAYGDYKRFYKCISSIVKLKPQGQFDIDFSYFNYHLFSEPHLFSERLVELLGPYRRADEKITQRHFDIAAAVQKVFEDLVFHLLGALYKETKLKNLCLSGGVALNCLANGKIAQNTPFKNVFVSPAPDDGGTSIGAAYFVYNLFNKGNRLTRNIYASPYLGPSYSQEEVLKQLKLYKANYKYIENPHKVAAELIAKKNIIGWFQGRMEFGERALGNRSILCDPRDPSMKDRLNKAVKFRESFRPFAPSILEEKAELYFYKAVSTPFMEKALRVLKEKRNEIPAVTHRDGTARLQTVSEKDNPSFRRLIQEFYKISNVPVVLNTSFNLQGEPIVCSPKDALRTFYTCGLDYLIMGNYLLLK